MRLDCYSGGTPLARVPRLAGDAEAMGFDGMWFTESRRNGFLACGAAALATEDVRIGTNIAVAFPRSPMVTAQVAWDLAEASRGRFVLGLGTQVKAHIERRFSTPFSRPAARIREYVVALRHIFAALQGTEKLAFQGDFYSFSLLPPFFSAGAIEWPDIPVHIAGVNTGMARVAGEVCDGFLAHPLHSTRYLDEVVRPAMAEGAASTGRSPGDVELVVPVFVVLGDTDEERRASREKLRAQIGFYGSTPTYASVFELHGWDDVPRRLNELQRAGDQAGMADVVTDEIVDAFVVDAPWERLADVLLERYRGRADRVLPYLTAGDWLEHPDRLERWRDVATAVHAA